MKSTDTDKGKLKIHNTHLKETYQCESFMKKAGHDFIYMKTYYFMLKVIGYKNIITNVTNLLQILQRWQNITDYSNNFVIWNVIHDRGNLWIAKTVFDVYFLRFGADLS